MTFDETSLEPLVSSLVPHFCQVMTLSIPIFRKSLPYPIYIVSTNPKVHVRVFWKAIQANGEKHNLNIVNILCFTLWDNNLECGKNFMQLDPRCVPSTSLKLLFENTTKKFKMMNRFVWYYV